MAVTVAVAMCFAGVNAFAASRPDAVKNIKARSSQSAITLTWSGQSKAAGYQVYRMIGSKYVKVKTIKTTSYKDQKLKANKKYQYKVRAFVKSGNKNVYGGFSKVFVKKTKAKMTVSSTAASVSMKWSKKVKASKYKVFRYTGKKAVYVKSTTGLKATVKALKPATSYKYLVKAYVKSGSRYKYAGVTYYGKIKTKAIEVSGITGSSTTSSVTLSWKKTKYATGYVIYKYDGNRYVRHCVHTNETCTDSQLAAGTKYSYKVRAYVRSGGKTYYGATSQAVEVTTAVEPAVAVKVVKSWNIGANDGATTVYSEATAGSNVVATLYDNGELAITGSGNTAVVDTSQSTPILMPWSGTGSISNMRITPTAYNITKVTMAATVKPVSMEAWFVGCDKLTAIAAVPSSVENLDYAFAGCTALTSTPDMSGATAVNSMVGAFYGCTSLVIADKLPQTAIDMASTFYGCTSLKTVSELPQMVNSLVNTFRGCTALKTAPAIPNRAESMIGTFYNCTSLTTCTSIPSTVKNMRLAFYGCSALTGTMVINPILSDNTDFYGDCFMNAASGGLTISGADTTTLNNLKSTNSTKITIN